MRTRMLVLAALLAACASTEKSAEIELDRTLYFPSPDGGMVAADPGCYEVEEGPDATLRLRTGDDEPLVVRAVKRTHEMELTEPVALIGPDEGEADTIVLLTPGGGGLESGGAAAEVSTRGFLRTRPRLGRSQVRYMTKKKLPYVRRTKKPPTTTKPAATRGPVHVRLSFVALRCYATTGEPGEDEVFVAAARDTPKGVSGFTYPPGGGVYGVRDGKWIWGSSNQKLLWQGVLDDGEMVHVVVKVEEKDGGVSAKEAAQELAASMPAVLVDALTGNKPGAVKKATEGSKPFFKAIVSAGENELLGTISITVWNQGGKIRKEFTCHKHAHLKNHTEEWLDRDTKAYKSPVRAYPGAPPKYPKVLPREAGDPPDITHWWQIGGRLYCAKRKTTWHAIAGNGTLIRAMLEGPGDEKYQGMFKVYDMDAPIAVDPDGRGVALKWTKDNTDLAH